MRKADDPSYRMTVMSLSVSQTSYLPLAGGSWPDTYESSICARSFLTSLLDMS